MSIVCRLAVRMEDKLKNLKIEGLGIGPNVARKLQQTGDGPWPGFENRGEFTPPAYKEALHRGVRPAK